MHGTHGVDHLVPAGVLTGDGQVDRITHFQRADGLLQPFPGFVGDGHDELALGDAGGPFGLNDLLHGAGDSGADLQLLTLGVGGQDHVHACLGVFCGGGEVVGEEVEAVGGADLVDVRDLQVVALEGRHEGEVGRADDGGAVSVEAQGV